MGEQQFISVVDFAQKSNKVGFCLFTAYVATAVPLEDVVGLAKTYPRYIEIPDGEGIMRNVDLEAEPDWELLSDVQRNAANNGYFLFTR